MRFFSELKRRTYLSGQFRKYGFTVYEDGFSLLEVCRTHYRDVGLDLQQLD